MERRAVAIRVFGDPEIGGALGMALGMGTTSFDPATGRATVPRDCRPRFAGNSPQDCFPGAQRPKGEGQKSADAGAVIDRARMEAEAVADRWIEGERLKRAVGNYKTAEEYEAMIEAAREEYGRVRINPVSCAVLAMIGLLVLMLTTFLEWEETQWRA